MKLFVTVAALLGGSAFASCPNSCSGHGTCNSKDQCECFKEDAIGEKFFIESDEVCAGKATQSACTGQGALGYACTWGQLKDKVYASTKVGEDDGECLATKTDVFVESSRYGSKLSAEWQGADCSRRTCPRGMSWTQLADPASHQASICSHRAEVECSDQGLCDRATGLCSCFPGYTGSACQRTECPDDCSGHGTCRSNKDFAYDFGVTKTHQLLQHPDSTEHFNENYVASYDNAWDSGMLYGCLCDVGYRGPSCSLVECPSGNDPLDDKCTAKALADLGLTDDEAKEYVENFQVQRFAATGASGWQAAYATSTSQEQAIVDLCNTAVNIASKAKCEATTMFIPYKGTLKCVHTAHPKTDPVPAANTCTSASAPNTACTHKDATKDKATCETGTACVFVAKGGTKAEVAAFNTCSQPELALITNNKNVQPAHADRNRHFYNGKVYSCFGAMSGQDCSGRGICDYSSGQCQCFSGYSGTACDQIDEMS